MKRQPVVARHSHSEQDEVIGNEQITDLDASLLTSGTVNGDRLPAISTTKKGAVPATGTPVNHYLRDDGNFQHPTQNEINGLEDTATPKFAGLGIGVDGVDGSFELEEGATIGDATGPRVKYNKAAAKFNVLDTDVKIGDEPSVPGTGGTWEQSYDSDSANIYRFVDWKGKLYAAGSGDVFCYDGSNWSKVLNTASNYCHALCVFGDYLYALTRASEVFYRTANGTDWDNVTPVTPTGAPSALIVYDGAMYGCFTWGEIWMTTNGLAWTKVKSQEGSTDWGFGMAVFNNDLYVCIHDAAAPYASAIYKFDGVTWSKVMRTTNVALFSLYSWNGKLYCGGNGGKYYYSSDGSNWSSAASLAPSGSVKDFYEFDGKLMAAVGTDIYYSEDGITWEIFYDCAEAAALCLIQFGDKLYFGTGTAGKVLVYTDDTAVFGRRLEVMGNATVHGQFRPGDMAGVEGDLLMSGGAGHGIWLPRGADHQYVGGVSGGQPVYRTIPASDVVFTPAGNLEAEDVQAAIEELDDEKAAAPIVKADTGDPASGIEGQVCVNTYDKTIKIYGGSAWRTVATWT